jgi:outer membrane protein with beta-barrel domain
MKSLFAAITLLLASVTAFGQEHSKLEFGAGFNYFRTDNHSIPSIAADRTGGNLNGGYGHATWFPSEYYGITADVGAAVGTVEYRDGSGSVGVDTRLYTFLFGPVIKLPAGRASVFASGKVGLAKLRRYAGGLEDSDHGFAFSVGGGIDYRLTNHFSVRPLQVDFIGTRLDQDRFGSDTQYNFRLGIGGVYRW